MARNRSLTEQRLINAVGAVLEVSGADGLNASAIAAQARVDKALVYKYFGGLDPLLRRYAETADLWWRAEDLLEGFRYSNNILDKSTIYGLILVRFLNALRRRPATLSILALEFNYHNVLCDILSIKREQETKRLFGLLGRLIGVPLNPDEMVGLSTYMHAITYAALLGRVRERSVFGLELGSADPAWTKLEAAVMTGARAQFAGGPGAGPPF